MQDIERFIRTFTEFHRRFLGDPLVGATPDDGEPPSVPGERGIDAIQPPAAA
jgi:hypothetical protein